MKTTIEHLSRKFKIDLSSPLDVSIPLRAGKENVNAWYVAPVTIEPVRNDMFVGAVAEGGAVNFRDIAFNPHGNGTHTECVGHISTEVFSINDALLNGFCIAELITVSGTILGESETEFRKKGDCVIMLEELKTAIAKRPEAIIIRTSPNKVDKLKMQYSNSNPPYLCAKAAKAIADAGIKHLLIDLPSVDRELDGGLMLAHRAFWTYPEEPRTKSTITELIYVNNEIKDGEYILNIQIAPFVNDASPSKPLLYMVEK